MKNRLVQKRFPAEILLKLCFQNSVGNLWYQYETLKINICTFCISTPKIVKDKIALSGL